MRAVVLDSGSMSVEERPEPVPERGELLVRVEAAGVNRADLGQRDGRYPAPPGAPQDIPGLELAGVVVGKGRGAGRFDVGERVMALVGGGAHAELCVVHERTALTVPPELTPLEAGGFAEAYATAADALFTQGALGPGETLLVTGAAGGVGVAAVQLGVAAGASVVASVRTPGSRRAVADLGATAIDPSYTSDHGPFDVVLELVGSASFQSGLANLATEGRIVVIGVAAGSVAEIDLTLLMTKRARLSGSTLRHRPLEAKAAVARLVESRVLPLVAAGRLRVPIDSSFDLGDVGAAYERYAAKGKFGKVVLTMAR